MSARKILLSESPVQIYNSVSVLTGDRGRTVVKMLFYKSEGRWFDSRSCHNPSDRTMALGSTQPLNRNEYQEYFLGVKSGRCLRLTTLTPSCAIVTKSGSVNFLAPSGHLRLLMGRIYLYLVF